MKETEKYFLDSSVWLAYFLAASEEIKKIIDSNPVLFTSAISLFEIRKRLIKENLQNKKIAQACEFIKENTIIIDIDTEISEKAVAISIKDKLHTVDALIYTSAIVNNAILVTADKKDFSSLNNVKIFS